LFQLSTECGRGALVNTLEGNTLTSLASYCYNFLALREFKIMWDGEIRGTGNMDKGTPQGSPLSPVIWLIHITRALSRAQGRIEELGPRHGAAVATTRSPRPASGSFT